MLAVMASRLPAPGTTALITGATAGIGAEFARQLAALGYNIVLVARDGSRLEESARRLRADYGIEAEVLSADLFTPEGKAAVEARLRTDVDRVTLLVNNAGYGLRKQFHENPINEELDHLALLVEVPLRLTHAALEQMLPAASGTIVNIASIAGFVPRGTYGAAKAWVLSFSRWANIFYGSRGVSVTAVAPGFVRTEFHERMKVSTAAIPDFLWVRADVLVRKALADIARGKAVSVPTVRYKFVVWLSGWVPKRLMAGGDPRGR
jgi:short-subunit dehydrogenase